MKKLIFGVALLTSLASAQVAINDTLYVNGGTWTGTISVCWPAFTTASGAVLAKSCRDTTVTSGVVAVSLYPTEGASPAVSYSAHYRTTSGPNRGVTWDETWAVASSPSIQILHDVRRSSSTQVFPSEIVATGLPTGTYCWSVVNATVTGLVACSGGGGGSMVYPGAGVPNSTGSAWGTSYTVGTSANNLVQLNGSAQLPAVGLANGATATTQAPGDSTTKLATDAFVAAAVSGLGAGHTQNTDTGTTQATFQLDSGNTGPKLKNNAGTLEVRNAADDDYAGAVASSLLVGDTTLTQAAGAVQSVVFSGTGPDDFTATIVSPRSGFAAFANECGIGQGDVVTVTIDGTGTPDTYSITACGVVQATGVAIGDPDRVLGGWSYLIENVWTKFVSTTGHTLADSWEITVSDTPVIDTRELHVYGSSVSPAAGIFTDYYQEVARSTPLPTFELFGVSYAGNIISPSPLVGADVFPNRVVNNLVTAPGSIGARLANQTVGTNRNCNLIVGSDWTDGRFNGANTTDCPTGRQMEIYGATDKPSQLLIENKSCTAATLATLIPLASQQCYCTDCQVTSGVDNTCTGSGSGAMAFRVGSDAKCLQ